MNGTEKVNLLQAVVLKRSWKGKKHFLFGFFTPPKKHWSRLIERRLASIRSARGGLCSVDRETGDARG